MQRISNVQCAQAAISTTEAVTFLVKAQRFSNTSLFCKYK